MGVAEWGGSWTRLIVAVCEMWCGGIERALEVTSHDSPQRFSAPKCRVCAYCYHAVVQDEGIHTAKQHRRRLFAGELECDTCYA